MASSPSSPFTKPHFPHSSLPPTPTPRHRKSCAQFLCKSFFFGIFLLLLPLFPSEAPDFVNQTLLSKFWELFHLMFVGIAVSYGLFSRRNIQVSVDEPRFSNFENPQAYLSKMFPVASIFEDVDDLSASDERKLSEVLYIQPNRGSLSDFGDLNAQSRGQEKLRCSIPKKRYENSHEFSDTDNVGHACKSRYTRDGSVVVVAETNRRSGEWLESGAIVNYKPLGLPVRSLRSNLPEPEDVEFDSGDESCLSSKSSSKSSENNCERRNEFGDNCCVNLEGKFDESVISSMSPFQLREKFGEKVIRERGVGNALVRPSHFRPPSIDETQFESLKKSSSLHSDLSQSSQSSSFSSSLSSTMRMHRKMSSLSNISYKLLHSRQYSRSSLSDYSRGSSENPLIEPENSSECNESVVSSPHLDRNFESIPKLLSRGKSVRTIRANAVAIEEMKAQKMYRNQVEHDDTVGKKFEEGGIISPYMREDGMGNGWLGVVNPNAGNVNRLPKTKFSGTEEQKEETESRVADDGKDNSEREDERFFASSDEEVASSMAGDSESGAHEVDKKAGEFIAKFREQIQLQRMASVEKRLRGGWGSFSSTSSSYFS